MKHFLLIPAALIALQPALANPDATATYVLPISQENHSQWMRTLTKQAPGGLALAILNRDVLTPTGEKGKWKDNIDIPRGSRLHGTTAQDGSGTTWDRLDLPNGDQVAVQPFTIKGLLNENE